MNGVSLQVNLPNCGKYEPSELKRILTDIAMELIGATDVALPNTYTEEEAKAIAIQRGRDIKTGRAKLIPHDEVMKEMDKLVASYAD